MHFTTVTANPCIDRTIQVDSVNLGHSHRVQKTICNFSGKGINVSLALTQLVFCVYDESGADWCLHKNLYLTNIDHFAPHFQISKNS